MTRKRRNPRERRQLYQDWKEAKARGISKVEFCNDHKISTAGLSNIIRKFSIEGQIDQPEKRSSKQKSFSGSFVLHQKLEKYEGVILYLSGIAHSQGVTLPPEADAIVKKHLF